MLIDIDTNKPITHIPHRAEFDACRARLSDEEFDAMVDRVNELIDAAGGEVATAGWLPGNDWAGTPFWPIYENAARLDRERAGLFFGQLVWFTVMNRPERWGSGKYEKDGVPIGAQTYFRLRD